MAGRRKTSVMKTIAAKLGCLPRAQRTLWPELDGTPKEFRLAGGTGLALQLGHRTSVDFDFFAFETIDVRRLLTSVPYLKKAKPVQMEANTLTVLLDRSGPVKVSFFGLPNLKPVAPPLKVEGSEVNTIVQCHRDCRLQGSGRATAG